MTRWIAIGALVLTLGIGAVVWLGSPQGNTAQPQWANGAAFAQDTPEADTSGIVEMTLGAPDAPVEFIEYASYTCPHCAQFHSDQFKRLKADYIDTDKVHFIYREVYFDQFGLWASIIARCGGPERFFGISDMLYEQQRDWIGDGRDPAAIADRLRRLGRIAGIGPAELETCLSDGDQARNLVAWYKENADRDQVTSTPTLVINGRKYSNMDYSEITEIIDDLLGQ